MLPLYSNALILIFENNNIYPIMELFLEILKFTIPALIVFASSYYILKQYLSNQYHMRTLEIKSQFGKEAIPLKLQAYERLLLFCDRINVPQLIIRLKTSDMTAEALRNSMMISIQKEYEHNIAQQLYTSQKLWEIIRLAKTELMNFIDIQSRSYTSSQSADELSRHLLQAYQNLKPNPSALAVQAIREEAKIILDVR